MKLATSSALAIYLMTTAVAERTKPGANGGADVTYPAYTEIRVVQADATPNANGYVAVPEVLRVRLTDPTKVPVDLVAGQMVVLEGVEVGTWAARDGARSGVSWSCESVRLASQPVPTNGSGNVSGVRPTLAGVGSGAK